MTDHTANSNSDTDSSILDQLVESSILLESDGDLTLIEDFRKDWRRRIEHLRERDAIKYLGLLLEADPDALIVDDSGNDLTVTRSGNTIGQWPSETALIADIAAFLTLQEWLSGWEEFEGRTRDELIGRLRVFLERCPSCDGELRSEGTKHETPSIVCPDCGAIVF